MSSEQDSRARDSKQQALEMQQKMLEIGARYLKRTIGELDDLRRMTTDISTNGVESLKELEVLAHRIRGSGAVFGYSKISDLAGEIEMLAVERMRSAQIDPQLADQFASYIDALAAEVSATSAAKTS